MSFPVPLPSTFMPLPLAIMIPFMGIQSGVMAQQFGMNFQYGKRKISAMSNEEFNKLTPQQMQADFSTQIKGMIPTFEQSLQDMRPFQRMIFIEMIAAFKEAVQLGLDIAGAGLGIDTSVPSIPKTKFTPGQAEIERGAVLPKAPRKQTRGAQTKTIVHRHTPEHHLPVHRHTPEHHLPTAEKAKAIKINLSEIAQLRKKLKTVTGNDRIILLTQLKRRTDLHTQLVRS